MKDILNWLKFLLMLLIAVGTVIFLVLALAERGMRDL